MSKSRYIKTLSLILACLFSLMTLCSCDFGGELRAVGMVGEYEVPYEEIYFLAKSYKGSLEAKYGEYSSLDANTKEVFDKELKDEVYSNITTNYAILSLCKEEGLTLESDGLDERVEEYINLIIQTDFNGNESDYEDSMEMYGLTDHYVRFTSAVDLLYSDFLAQKLEEMDNKIDDEKLKENIKNEFVRTWHIMIFNDEGESVEANRQKAEEALSKLNEGSMSMYKLIGSPYNEDLSLTDLDGLYFGRGTRNEAYEAAAFSLEVGGFSDVIELSYENPQGAVVSAFCILQRLEIEDTYVNQNLSALKKEYVNSQISVMVEDQKNELEFVPNDYGSSLELAELEKPGFFSNPIFIICFAISLLIIVVTIVIFVKKKKEASATKGKQVKKTAKKDRISRGK